MLIDIIHYLFSVNSVMISLYLSCYRQIHYDTFTSEDTAFYFDSFLVEFTGVY